jgi:glutamate 5-kinase
MGNIQRIVVKLGTSTLTGGGKQLSHSRMVDIARQVASAHEAGHDVVLVSSGAIAAGREVLGYPDLPKFIPKKQMLSAVGQPRLMALYEQFFAIYGQRVSQVLLTREDLTDRRRYLNARNTLDALLMQKVVPIINENDTVATDEIRFGDNDSLSAQVSSLIEADLLILLTDQDGLFTGDPRQDPDARLIGEVPPQEIPDMLWAAAGGSRSGLGTGGMSTKLYAADLARHSGTTVFIARGDLDNVLSRIIAGEKIGTCFPPLANKLEGRKRYLLANDRAVGMLRVDAGASRALAHGGSLLPVGVCAIQGEFERGDTVRVINSNEKMIGLGLSNYSSKDLAVVFGKQSKEIETILGFTFGDEVIHRNNMILL